MRLSCKNCNTPQGHQVAESETQLHWNSPDVRKYRHQVRFSGAQLPLTPAWLHWDWVPTPEMVTRMSGYRCVHWQGGRVVLVLVWQLACGLNPQKRPLSSVANVNGYAWG